MPRLPQIPGQSLHLANDLGCSVVEWYLDMTIENQISSKIKTYHFDMNFEINVSHAPSRYPCVHLSISFLHRIHNVLCSLPMLESLPRPFLSEVTWISMEFLNPLYTGVAMHHKILCFTGLVKSSRIATQNYTLNVTKK